MPAHDIIVSVSEGTPGLAPTHLRLAWRVELTGEARAGEALAADSEECELEARKTSVPGGFRGAIARFATDSDLRVARPSVERNSGLPMDTIFLSYSFTDPNSAALCRLAREVASGLRRVTIVEGKNLDVRSDFSVTISTYIKEQVDCVVAIFTSDETAKPNVLFEVGIGVGASKEVILIAEAPEHVPSMLKGYDHLIIDRNDLGWYAAFRASFEQKLRRLLQIPGDHLVEDKIARRYQPEERRHFRHPENLRAAMKTIQDGDLSKAEAILKRALQFNSSDVDALFLLAECSYLKGCSNRNPSEREQLFVEQERITSRALQHDQNNPLLLNSRGQAEFRLGRFADARSTFVRVLELDPGFSPARYNLSCLSALERDTAGAVRLLREAIAQNKIWRDFSKGDPDFSELWQEHDWIDLVYS
jgi:tetratricopeptide (TPR) repeat protein